MLLTLLVVGAWAGLCLMKSDIPQSLFSAMLLYPVTEGVSTDPLKEHSIEMTISVAPPVSIESVPEPVALVEDVSIESLPGEEDKPSPEQEIQEEDSQDVPEAIVFLSEDEILSLINQSPVKEELLQMRNPKRKRSLEQLSRSLYFETLENILPLIPLLQSNDPFLVQGLADVMSTLQVEEAVNPLIERLDSETNPPLRLTLLKYCGRLDQESMKQYLEKEFLSQESLEALLAVCPGLIGRNTDALAKRAKELSRKSPHLMLRAHCHALLAAMGRTECLDFANKFYLGEQLGVKVLCMQIFQYIGGAPELEKLHKHRRQFYRSIVLMQAYLKARVILKAGELKGEKRWNEMVALCDRNDDVLAWLAFYLSKDLEARDSNWLKQFLVDQPLEEFHDFIQARVAVFGQAELPAEYAGRKSVRSSAVNNTPKTHLLGEFKIRGSLEGVTLLIDGQPWSHSQGVFTVPVGLREIQCQFKDGAELNDTIEVMANKRIQFRMESRQLDIGYWNSVEMPMGYIPVGQFQNKQSSQGAVINIPSPLYVGLHEVTNKQFEFFMPEHQHHRDRHSAEDDTPVIMVSWYDAINFCNWLSVQEGHPAAYNSHHVRYRDRGGYRLLTEAEWEYVACAGNSNNVYATGEKLEEDGKVLANIATREGSSDGFRYAAPVASFVDNDFGVFDMTGNVSEWCENWFDPEEWSVTPKIWNDPRGPRLGSTRAIRGGSYQSRARLEVSYRDGAHPADISYARGFRVVRLAQETYELVEEGVQELSAEAADPNT